MEDVKQPVAVIDLGSNSFHLVIVNQNGLVWQPLEHIREAVRLRAGLSSKGLMPETKAKVLFTMRRFRAVLDKWQPIQTTIVATAAFRQFSEAQTLLREAEAILQHPIEILSGAKEAEGVFKAVQARDNPLLKVPSLIADIGGGSTELIIGHQTHCQALASVDLGVLSISQPFQESRFLCPKTFQLIVIKAKAYLGAMPAAFFSCYLSQGILTSGIAEAMLTVGEALEISPCFTLASLEKIKNDLFLHDNWRSWLCQLGLCPDRANILPAGLGIMMALMETFGLSKLYPSKACLREGILLSMQAQPLLLDTNQSAASRA